VEVQDFAAWFVGAVENFRSFDASVYAFADSEAAVAEVRGEGRIKATGRIYEQEYRCLPPCLRWEDRFSARVLRSHSGREGDGRAH
jgi:hypothetical protein